jgi:holo-[acyl-carrier protein] synthase
MIVGIGVDLLDCRRLEREMSGRPWQSTEGIFTEAEIRSCGNGKRGAARFAACFVAKEAALKALGSEVSDLELLREVEITYKPGGEPAITLHSRAQSLAQGLDVKHIWISIASAKEHAGAFVVMES